MRYAVITNGLVGNIITLRSTNAGEFSGAVALHDRPVGIGDSYTDGKFWRDGEKILTPAEEITAMQTAAVAALRFVTVDNDRLAASALYPKWEEGQHETGDIYTARGQVWECIQAYDNAVYPDIVPGNVAWGTFHRPLHATSPDTARPWVSPTGAHDQYKAGEYMTLDGTLYKCLTDTAYSPTEYTDAWEAVV
nr:MAG TPA: Chitin oligosaccharide deacetylase [Bacteriophage sp.]